MTLRIERRTISSRRSANECKPSRVLSQTTCRHKQWDIRDKDLPQPVSNDDYDSFEPWPDGDSQKIYHATSTANGGDVNERGEQAAAGRHWTGWAMRNTNNHNQQLLKKSCLGLLICSNSRCHGDVRIRPAICDKARSKQIDRPCRASGCDGKIILRRCRGNRDFPVTHFWRSVGTTIYFQSKGTHDHAQPTLNWADRILSTNVRVFNVDAKNPLKRSASVRDLSDSCQVVPVKRLRTEINCMEDVSANHSYTADHMTSQDTFAEGMKWSDFIKARHFGHSLVDCCDEPDEDSFTSRGTVINDDFLVPKSSLKWDFLPRDVASNWKTIEKAISCIWYDQCYEIQPPVASNTFIPLHCNDTSSAPSNDLTMMSYPSPPLHPANSYINESAAEVNSYKMMSACDAADESVLSWHSMTSSSAVLCDWSLHEDLTDGLAIMARHAGIQD